jgi:hypothetical protein
MRMKSRAWPTSSQQLLLRAALSEGDPAAAWDQWRRSGGQIDDLDRDAQRVLPQLYRNLVAAGCEDPDRERLKGIYRHSWSSNQILFNAVGPVLHAFRDAGIEAMVLKGGAVAGLYPDGLGTRPMRDIDILLRREAVDDGLVVLAEHGITAPDPSGLVRARRAKHSESLSGPNGFDLDLHWEALFKVGSDSSLWRSARPGVLGDAPVLVPGLADQLLHACVHGTGFTPAPMRWITDAMLILRASDGELDWEHLIAAAREHHASRNLHRALSVLVTDFDAVIPREALSRLARIPVSPIERLESRVCSWSRRPPGVAHVEELDRYLGVCRRDGNGASLGGYVDHLADAMNVDNRRAVFTYHARRIASLTR